MQALQKLLSTGNKKRRAKDLESLNVDMELFAMPNCNHMRPVFDIKKFFANIITFDEDELTNGLLDIETA